MIKNIDGTISGMINGIIVTWKRHMLPCAGLVDKIYLKHGPHVKKIKDTIPGAYGLNWTPHMYIWHTIAAIGNLDINLEGTEVAQLPESDASGLSEHDDKPLDGPG